GSYAGYRGTGQDVTAVIEAEERAARAQDRLAHAIEAMPLAAALFDRNERLVRWNRAHAALFRHTGRELTSGLSFDVLLRGSMDAFSTDANRTESLQRRLAFHRNPVGSFERQLVDGGWEELREYPLPDGGFMLMIADITARKQVEAELHVAKETAEA